MAEIQKRAKPRSPLGMPPSPAETRGNLLEPEVAPSSATTLAAKSQKRTQPKETGKVDGRTLRRTGRTVQFSTRVHPDFKTDIHRIAKATGKKYNEILEESLALYRQHIAT